MEMKHRLYPNASTKNPVLQSNLQQQSDSVESLSHLNINCSVLAKLLSVQKDVCSMVH